MLPSQVLEQASTMDLWIYDVAVSYRLHLEKKEQAKQQGHSAPQSISQEDLLKGLEKFRETRN